MTINTYTVLCFLLMTSTCGRILKRTLQSSVETSVIAETIYGKIRGIRKTASQDLGKAAMTNQVDIFLGVPYGASTAGQNRFKPGIDPKPWTGVRDGTVHGDACPQVSYYSQTKPELLGEDCLNLNIFTPFRESYQRIKGENVTRLYPVFVFIHGGSYEEGSGNRYDGTVLAQFGIVVVTINYRLGELGFITTGNEILPGNYGLYDQIQSLRWINKNIANFRGDPSRVTIAGSSAGAASVGLMMVTPNAQGLFHQAIFQSGSPLANWAVYNQTSMSLGDFLHVMGLKVGCSVNGDSEGLIKCLRAIHWKEYIKNHWELPGITPSHLNFKPRVDGYLIPGYPSTLFINQLFPKMPIMIGNVNDEWSRSMGWFFKDISTEEIDKDFADGFEQEAFCQAVKHVLMNRFGYSKTSIDIALTLYSSKANESDSYKNREHYYRMMSDLLMIAPSVKLANILAQGSQPIYYYLYNHSSSLTKEKWWGTYHSLELDSVFGSPFSGYDIATDTNANHTSEDKEISLLVMRLWSSFVINGDPTPGEAQKESKWYSVNSSLINHLYLTSKSSVMKPALRPEQMHLWNSLLPEITRIERQKQDQATICSFQSLQCQSYKTISWTLAVILATVIVSVSVLGIMKRFHFGHRFVS